MTSRASSLWIFSPKVDLVVFLGLPLVLLAAFATFDMLGVTLALAAYVSVSATGHHLPTFLRAYSEANLVRRFPIRLLLLPVLVFAAFYLCLKEKYGAMTLLLLLWGHWHGMMQVYGFARIYDAKAGSFTARTTNLDWLVVFFGFLAGLVVSDFRLLDIFDAISPLGISPLSANAITGLRYGLVGIFIGLLTLSVVNYWLGRRSGEVQSPIKWLYLLTGIGFWWYCNNVVASAVIALAMNELFHDFQYVAFVWQYNHKRQEQGKASAFAKFLFRRQVALVALYVVLIFAYGFVSRLPGRFREYDTLALIFSAYLGTSTLLHFYFDGFIWKLKDSTLRAGFQVVEGKVARGTQIVGIPHNSLTLVVVLLLGLAIYAQQSSKVDQSSYLHALSQSMPASKEVNYRLALDLADKGQLVAARSRLQSVVYSDEHFRDALFLYGRITLDLGFPASAEKLLRRELESRPDNLLAQRELAFALQRQGKISETKATLEAVERQNGFDPVVKFHLGKIYLSENRIMEAVARFYDTLKLDPNFGPARAELLAMGYGVQPNPPSR